MSNLTFNEKVFFPFSEIFTALLDTSSIWGSYR